MRDMTHTCDMAHSDWRVESGRRGSSDVDGGGGFFGGGGGGGKEGGGRVMELYGKATIIF